MDAFSFLPILALSDGLGMGFILVLLAVAFMGMMVVLIPILAGMWKIFTKIGKPGWAALVPVFNIWILVKFIGKEDWWVILFFIPMVNIFAAFVVWNELVKGFGKDSTFTLGLTFFARCLRSTPWLRICPISGCCPGSIAMVKGVL